MLLIIGLSLDKDNLSCLCFSHKSFFFLECAMPRKSVEAPTWRNRIVGHADIAPKELQPSPWNWREHPLLQREALQGTLKELGWIQEIVVNQRSNHLIDGHLRLALALEQGEATVPVLYVDLSEDEERLALLMLDPLSAMAESNKDQLAALLQDVQSGDAAIQQMLSELAQREGIVPLDMATDGSGSGTTVTEPEEPWDRLAEVLERWHVQAGDLWGLGTHRVICGDCLDPHTLAHLLDDKVPHMIFADPPYGVSIVATNVPVGGGEAYDIPFGGVKQPRRRIHVGGGQRQKDLTGHYPIETWGKPVRGTDGAPKPFGSKAQQVRGSVGAAHVVAVGKYAPVIGDNSPETAIHASNHFLTTYPNAVHVWWGGNYYADHLPASPCWLVWNKETTGNFADCELAWTNQDKAARLFTHRWNGMLRDSEHERRWHPTQKPAALAAWVYETLGQPGDIILDPFLGSGPSLLAAEQTGRTVYGCELSIEYISIALERWHQLTGQQPQRIG
jgi:hypothetical protein